MKSIRVLFVASEAMPWVKTGGLADVAGHLPPALRQLGVDVRLLLPAYREVTRQCGDCTVLGDLKLPYGTGPARLLVTATGADAAGIYLVDAPRLFDRPGGPYLDAEGLDWDDNAVRFAAFSHAAVQLAVDAVGLGWRPQIVHCNDWHTGLVPALLTLRDQPPATVFTIHNLAYQGIFDYATFRALGLPTRWWHPEFLEYYDNLCFIKGGLVFADMLTTVSPTYAKEILTPQYGCGLDGVLRARSERLHGILNGVDYDVWNPTRDSLISAPYGPDDLPGKALNKRSLQKELGLALRADVPLIAFIGRLVEQKGIDLLIETAPDLLGTVGVQLVVLGTGRGEFERALSALARRYPEKMAVHIGFNEGLAHRVEAGADILLMPSRFEPCGLNQMYSLRYGTVPIVHGVGGLADTVVDVGRPADAGRRPTGFVIAAPDAKLLLDAISRAARMYRERPREWRTLIHNGMQRDFSWLRSARVYLDQYRLLLAHRSDSLPETRARR